jgi:signal transduction histidine kinase
MRWTERRPLVGLLIFLVLGTTAGLAAVGGPAVHRILLIYENEPTQPAVQEIAAGFHRRMAGRQARLEIYSEYLDLTRFPSDDWRRRLADVLVAKYAGVDLGLVIAVGPNASRFVIDNRAALARGAPLLFGAVSGSAEDEERQTLGRSVVSRYDVRGLLDLVRSLQPRATRATVLTGSSVFDRDWERVARRDLGDSHAGFAVDYVSGLSLDGFVQAARGLPPDTVAVILAVSEDSTGRKLVPRDAAAAIAATASVPAYSVYDTYLGGGVTGVWGEPFESVGSRLADVARSMLDGDSDLPAVLESQPHAIVDWRQLKRWGIDAAALPKGAEIRYHTPTAWEEYRTEILAAAALILLQAALIAALIVQGRRRRRAEEEAAVGRLELTHLARTAVLGELSGAFAHELNQPLTAILANAEAGKRMLEKGDADLAELEEILREIADDDRRAASVITGLRRLLVKREAVLEPVDINQIVSATLGLANSDLLARRTQVEFRRAQGSIAVLGNFSQLQQVVLNLVLNAADAMARLPAASRVVVVETANGDDGFGRVAVSDSGPGLTSDLREKAFEPFVSTKPNGLGLGLAICRSIITAHGGRIGFDADRVPGARVVLALPKLEPRYE